jgi:hypothetical protein
VSRIKTAAANVIDSMSRRILAAVLAAAVLAGCSSTSGDAGACRTVGESLQTAIHAIDALQTTTNRANIAAADSALADLEDAAGKATASAADVKALMLRIKAASTATRGSQSLLLSGSRIVAASDAWMTTCKPLI